MLRNCLEEDVCLYRPNTRWEGEFEWLKTLQGPQLENCRKLLSHWVRKPLKKNCQTSSISPHVVWEGFKKNYPSSSKNKLQHIQYQTRLELQMGLASMVRWNKKKGFLAANTQDGFVNTGIKSTPCVQINILLYFWCCGSIFLLEVLDIFFRRMASWILSNTNR